MLSNYIFIRFNLKLRVIVFFIFSIIKKIYCESGQIEGTYPNVLLLNNGNLFISNNLGMFVYDADLIHKIKEHAYYNKSIDSDEIEKISSKTLIAQFEGINGMIICLVENTIYFFNYEGDFLFMDLLPENDYSSSYFNLITDKIEENYYYYIITFIKYNNMYILYYKTNNKKNELVIQKSFRPFYFDYPRIYIADSYLGCQIMLSENKGKVLTCSFNTMPKFIIIQSFLISNEFEPIGDNIYAKVATDASKIIHSLVSENKKKLLTCFLAANDKGYCFIFDIDTNSIIKYEPLIQRCTNDYNRFKLFYDKQKNEYIFACQVEKKFTIMRMNSDFEIINKNNYSTFNFELNYNCNKFSLLYDTTENKYAFIIDAYLNNIRNYYIMKSYINTDFENDFDGGTLPEPFEETPPDTTPYTLSGNDKYYLEVKEFFRPITVNELNGIMIDFLDNKNNLIKTKDKKQINKELYAINFESLPPGQLKYYINGVETDVELNTRIFGEFKFKYYPLEQYQQRSSIIYTVYLRNYIIASIQSKYWLITCKKNCSCTTDTGTCLSCVNGYTFYQTYDKCILGSDICSNLYYSDNETKLLICMDENINDCPENYPIYDSKTRECKQNISELDIDLETQKDSERESELEHSESIINSESTNNQENLNNIDLSSINNNSGLINEIIIKKILELIFEKKDNNNIEDLEEMIEPIKAYSIISSIIKSGNINISSGDKDIILKGKNVTYQITNTENQKKVNQSEELSIIDLGNCEKIIKKNISYEDDPTPLIIFKIDLKKEGIKSSAVEYEVYNPYTKDKINLEICAETKISIISPVNLTPEETILYDSLKSQGYELYDPYNSFYQDICTQYTSKNGTDVILVDRKNYFYDEKAIFCENLCTYEGINTETKKVICFCETKKKIDFESNNFDKNKFLGNFYKIEDYTNYQVLFCYKLVLCSKGLKNNICFYIFIVLFILFLSTMIINLLKALKKIDEIIFKIIENKFMLEIMRNIIKNKREQNINEIQNNNNNNQIDNKKNEENQNSSNETSKQLFLFQKLKKKYKKKKRRKRKDKTDINNTNINNDINYNKEININNNINNTNINNNSNQINFNFNNNIKDINDNFARSDNNIIRINRRVNFKQNSLFKINNNSNNSIKEKSSNLSKFYKESNDNNDKINIKIISNKNNNTIDDSNNNITNSCNNLYKQKKKKIKSLRNSYTNSTLKNIPNKNNDLNSINNNIDNLNPPMKKITTLNGNLKEKNIKNSKIENNNIKNKLKSKKKSKIKILRNSINVMKNKSNNLISNSNILVKFKNEDIASKKHLLRKNEFYENEIINKNKNKIKEKFPEEKKENRKYIDEELNHMSYKDALLFDKRTYCQYYLSLLKKKHLIILVFISNDDYNIFLLKFSLFLLSISLFFAINTLFFRDSTMRYIYNNQGRYNFIYQIPQVIYSTIISSIMTYILKILSLSQNDLIKIKRESDKAIAREMTDKAKKCLKIKLYAFFFLGLCLLIFCWYYITAFCAVYPNTQLHLIKDTLISFGISMIYPFLINLLPGIFRISALNSEKKDQVCLYRISSIIAYL